ncbi:hypothetical protein EV424DRAFT_1305442, partial [Suillus variegatus]
LGNRGCILRNYPDNTLMPGERRTTLTTSKGIHDLTLRERSVLVDALKNDLLTLQHVTDHDAHRRLLFSRDPVIYGEAPSAESPHSHGRRQFLDCRIDRRGLPRLT